MGKGWRKNRGFLKLGLVTCRHYRILPSSNYYSMAGSSNMQQQLRGFCKSSIILLPLSRVVLYKLTESQPLSSRWDIGLSNPQVMDGGDGQKDRKWVESGTF